MLLNLEAVEKSHVQEIELSVGKQGSGAHAIAHAVGEQGGIGLLEPALGSEDLGICPDLLVLEVLARVLHFDGWSLTHVASPGVQKDDSSLGNGNSIVDNILDRGAR